MPDIDRKRVADLIRSSETAYEHFFDNVDDVAWIAPLVAEGFFKDPQPAEKGEDWVRYPFWPESRFLVRVAAAAPEQVTEIAAQIPDTDNVRVHEDVLRIAAQVSGPLGRVLARKETKWLSGYDGNLVSLPGAIGELLAHLAEEGEVTAAYELADQALAIRPRENDGYLRRDAGVARMNEYEYGRIINQAWPALIQRDPLRALRFLCGKLEQLVSLDEHDGVRDPASVWRSAIEDHAQNLGRSLLDLLIDVVRDYALRVSDETAVGFDATLDELTNRGRAVFDRIALNLVRERGTPASVARFLTDRSWAFDVSRWHEYGTLLRDRYIDLDSDQRHAVLDVLDAGYDDAYRSRLADRGVSAEDVAAWERSSQLNRYVLIREHLDPDHVVTIDQLVAEFGEPGHPTFLSYSTSWTGPTSPFNSEQLRSMTPRELVEALRTWTPKEGPQEASPEGLGRLLSDVVRDAPATYAEAAELFEGLEPTYVRAVLSGLTAAAQADTAFEWAPVLSLCLWVVAQPRAADDTRDDFDRDFHWGWARKQAAALLSRGMASGDAELPIEFRQQAWDILSVLSDDPDPTPSHEERFGGDNMDPATLSINTARGEAMHAVVRYALWVERHLSIDGIASMPEVQRTLERHLDVAIDPSVAVRSVYGQWMVQLVRIDLEWSRSIAPLVFPTAPDQAQLFDAAWNSYILFNHAYGDTYMVLHDAYQHAVQRLDAIGEGGLAGDPRKRLGDHLFLLHARGNLGAVPNLFSDYWRHADTTIRAEVLTSIGWSLEATPELDAGMFDNIAAAWAWIVDATDIDDAAGLSGFGAWFAASVLDADWRLQQALEVLGRGVHLEPDFKAYETLPGLAGQHADRVLDVLRRMIMTDTEAYSPWGSAEEIKATLDVAFASEDADVRRRAQEIADLLGARDVLAFRDLGPQ